MPVFDRWKPGEKRVQKQLSASLYTVVSFLEEHGYRYAIIGGIALAQWNVVRATYDVDLKILVPNYDYTAVRSALQAAFPQPARAQLPPNSLIVAVLVDDIIVDFLLALPGYEELIVERAVLRDMGGWQAWVCSAEDLIIQKAVAGREKDWLDIESLLGVHSNDLDDAYIEEWLEQFSEALDNPDISIQYRRARQRVIASQKK
jgi:predicted nucleotidyltransferase